MAQGGYAKEMDRIIASLEGRPRLLLHACCAPCSSAVLELLEELREVDWKEIRVPSAYLEKKVRECLLRREALLAAL